MRNLTSTLINAILATILLTSVSFAFIPSTLAMTKFVVSPTGVDDTDNIQAAFDAAVASGPDSIISLTAGTFYLSRPIVVVNFDGTFKGAGKDVTIIQNHGDEPFPLLEPPLMPYPSLFLFYQDENGAPSNIRVKGMTIRAVGEAVEWNFAGTPNRAFQYLLAVGPWIAGVEDFEPSYISTTVKQVAFEGEVGDFLLGYNVMHALNIMGEGLSELYPGGILAKYDKPIVGTQIVTDSSFRNAGVGSSIYGVWDSTATIQGCTYDNVLMGIQLHDFSNAAATVEKNDFKNVHWIGVTFRTAFLAFVGYHFGPFPELYPEPSSFLIRDNTIQAIDLADGIGIVDWSSYMGEGKTLDAVVESNTFILDTPWWGGMWGFGAQDVKVLDNSFEGIGAYGIDVCWGSSRWEIIDNDMEDLEADIAHIWLEPGSSECFLEYKEGTVVLDYGIDNTIVLED